MTQPVFSVPENKKLKNITKERNENFYSSTSKMFKHPNMIKYVITSTSPTHLGLSQSLLMWFLCQSSVSLWWFNVHDEETPLHIRTATGLAATWNFLIAWRLETGLWQWLHGWWMLMLILQNDENWFLWLLVLDNWCRVDIYDDECGRFSISSWMVWCPIP